jgi:L-lysine 2,3-aminomutase
VTLYTAHLVTVILQALQAPAHYCRHCDHQHITAGTAITGTLLQALQSPAHNCRHCNHQHITGGTAITSTLLQALQSPAHYCRHCNHQHITADTAITSTSMQALQTPAHYCSTPVFSFHRTFFLPATRFPAYVIPNSHCQLQCTAFCENKCVA